MFLHSKIIKYILNKMFKLKVKLLGTIDKVVAVLPKYPYHTVQYFFSSMRCTDRTIPYRKIDRQFFAIKQTNSIF